ncbi:MAG: right-handed parallel beta-helix repeat-containing protein [Muribaculaceae bacterium]|nr:right-handed parallel beta-helix repeat-containing protein [Muribaculaceae bacterium]
MKVKALLSITCICLGALAASAETYTVKTAEEFVNALGSDRTIVIDTQVPIILTPTIDQLAIERKINKFNYYTGGNDYAGIGYYDNGDGSGLALVGLKNLVIEAKEGTTGALLTSPRQADVLTFESCENITLNRLTLGHTAGGGCECGVIGLLGCTDVTIARCNLFGCGSEGIFVKDSKNVLMQTSSIHDCTYYTLHVADSNNVRFNNCGFRDNKRMDQINVNKSQDVSFTDCNFINLQGRLFFIDCPTSFVRCMFDKCEYNPSEMTEMIACKVMNCDNAPAPIVPAAMVPASEKELTPSQLLHGEWMYEDTNTIPYSAFTITIDDDWSFKVSVQEGSPEKDADSKLRNYFGKCWEKERLSNNEVVIEYRIDTVNSSDDNFTNKKKTIKGKFRVTQGCDDEYFWTLTPIDGLDFGIPKGKSRRFNNLPEEIVE